MANTSPATRNTGGRSDFLPYPAVRPGRLPVIVIAIIVAAPLLAIISYIGVPTGGLWTHLWQTRLGEYLLNTLILSIGVGSLTLIIGTGCAWLVTMYRFPGRALFEWLLILPLAMPTYVLAYTYTDLLQFVGPLQSALRAVTGWGWGDYWFPNIRSPGGAIMVLTAALYPYVYVAARSAFLAQSVCVLEVSRTLGCSPRQMFLRVGFPLARPAVMAGTVFVLMESLADFGAVSYFELNTFTTGIYRSWYAYGNPAAAAQLASLLLLFVYTLLMIERSAEGRRRYAHTSSRYRPLSPLPLRRARALAATICCLLPLSIGFLLPAVALVRMAWRAQDVIIWPRLWTLTLNTMTLAAIAGALVVILALAVGYAARRDNGWWQRALIRLALLGYATPGVVIAVGLLLTLGAADRLLGGFWQTLTGVSPGLILSGTLIALVYGYAVRFFAIAYRTLEAGQKKIRPGYEDVARTLGAAPKRIFTAIHLPLLRGSLLSAALLVFVDVMKELPATLILRPFNFDTLAVEAYQLATTERLDGAAGPALVIVLAGLLPVILLCRAITRSRPAQPLP